MVQMQKQQAERMEGLQVGTFEMSFVYSMILNILSSTKFGLLVYTFLTHFHGWNLKIIEYNMNLLDLIIDKCTLTWWWMCCTQQNDVFVYLLEFSFLSEY